MCVRLFVGLGACMFKCMRARNVRLACVLVCMYYDVVFCGAMHAWMHACMYADLPASM